MKRIIMVSGKAEHGKTTLAQMLKEELPNAVVVNFGDKVKRFCADYFDWDGQKDEKGRELLQMVGTEFIESRNMPNYWVSTVLTEISILAEKYDYFIIADWRFKKEINYLLATIGHQHVFPIRVERSNHISRLTEEQLNHRSEIDLDDFMVMTIENNKDTASLREDAKWLAQKIVEIDNCVDNPNLCAELIKIGQRVLYQDLIKNDVTDAVERVILIGTVSAIGPEGILVDFGGALKGHAGDMTQFATGERYPNGKPSDDEPNHWFVDYDEMQKVFPI